MLVLGLVLELRLDFVKVRTSVTVRVRVEDSFRVSVRVVFVLVLESVLALGRVAVNLVRMVLSVWSKKDEFPHLGLLVVRECAATDRVRVRVRVRSAQQLNWRQCR